MNKKKGFTLIELLIVMTIIAVLAGMALVSYNGARRAARDSKRKADLEQIRGALEMCYADENQYPGSIDPDVACGGETYLSPTPVDPINNPSEGYEYVYNRGADNITYSLCCELETEADRYCVSSP
jgi:general secretion pathway protein G